MTALLDACRLCLVTDRGMAGPRDLSAIARDAVAGGVTMVQLRDKQASTRRMVADAEALLAVLRPAGVPLIVNDRVDVALASRADGVHVGQDDMPVGLVRRLIGPKAIVGLSITREADLADPDLACADYLGVGPIFAQTTKGDAAPPLGLDGLARIRAMTPQPLMAIGGVSASCAASLRGAGADGLAVVSAIMAALDPQEAACRIRAAMDEGAAAQA